MEECGDLVVFHELLSKQVVVGELLGQDVLAAELRGRRRGAGRGGRSATREPLSWPTDRSRLGCAGVAAA